MYTYLVFADAASQGDLETAQKAAEILTTLDPDVQLFRENAALLLARRKPLEARTCAMDGLKQYPDDLSLTLLISESYMLEKKHADAMTTLNHFVKKFPKNTEAILEMARLLLLNQKFAEAKTLVERIQENKRSIHARYIHGMALIGIKRFEDGEKALRRVVKDDPEFTDAWVNLALSLQSRGKHIESAAIYRKFLENDKANPAIWLRLVETYLQAKRPDLALKALTQAPSMPLLHMEAAVLFLEQHYYKEAEKLLNSTKNAPGAPAEVLFYLAAIEVEYKKNPNAALKLLREVPANSPMAERSTRWSLQMLTDAGRMDEALALSKEQLTNHPDKLEFHIIAAQTLLQVEKKDEAEELLRKSLQRWPANPDLAYCLASVLDLKGHKNEALTLMEEVIQKNPNHPQALNYVGYTLAEQKRDLKRARDLIIKAVTNAPDDYHILDSLAWVYYQMDNYQDAMKTITQCIKMGADHPVIWEHYGDIALKIGNNDHAKKAYQKALSLTPENPDVLRKKLEALP